MVDYLSTVSIVAYRRCLKAPFKIHPNTPKYLPHSSEEVGFLSLALLCKSLLFLMKAHSELRQKVIDAYKNKESLY